MAARDSLLVGYYGVSNLGDELMLACLAKWLQAQNYSVTVVAENAQQVETTQHLPAIQNRPLLGFGWVNSWLRGKVFDLLSRIRSCDAVFAGGGDIIRDQLGWRTFSYQVEKLLFALVVGKPVYLVNVGITQPRTRYGRAVLKRLLPRCRRIIVRDTRSLELCRQYGAASITHLLPDIVFDLPRFFPMEPSANQDNVPTALVALHGDPNCYGSFDMNDRRIAAFAAALDQLVTDRGMQIEFFPCQIQGALDDHRVARKVIAAMKHADRTRLLDWTADAKQVSERFARSSLVLGMRLHAAILGIAFAKPTVLLPYDAKVSELGKYVGVKTVIEATTLDSPDAAFAVIQEALSTPPPAVSVDWLSQRI